MAKALSMGKGKGSIAHNNREYKAHNVVEERTVENVKYKTQPIAEAYEELFGEAVEKFNESARSDRKIKGSYFEHLFNQDPNTPQAKNVLTGKNKQKSFYEDVVQVGDMHDSGIGTAGRATVAKVLDVYMKGWQARNPQFHVFNAVLHMDEKTPHLHIDYIPVAESKRGLTVQNGMQKALEQMGFPTPDKQNIGFMAWREKERNILGEICRQFGIEPAPPKPRRGVDLLPDVYKAEKDAQRKEIESGIQSLQKEQNRLQSDLEPLKRMEVRADEIQTKEEDGKDRHKHDKTIFTGKESVTVPKEDYDKMMEQSKAYRVNRPKIKKLDEREKALDERKNALDERERKVNNINEQNKKTLAEFNQAMQPLEQHCNTGGDALGFIRQLQAENSRLKKIAEELRAKVATLEKTLAEVKETAQNALENAWNRCGAVVSAINAWFNPCKEITALNKYVDKWASADGIDPNIIKEGEISKGIQDILKPKERERLP